MSTFLCKNGVRKEYFLTPTFIIEPNKDAIIFLKAPFFLSKGTATVKPAAARIDGLKIRQALLAGTEPN